jgi:HAD superfamily hydrolase (TIGR01484 family)
VIPRVLLSTDLDRTLLPNGAAPESPGARDLFAAVAARSEVVLVYVTGRHQELVQEAMQTFDLPLPDLVIGDVGTSLYEVGPDGWLLAPGWQAVLASQWGPERRKEIRTGLAHVRELTVQEEAKQGPFKVSFYTPAEASPWLPQVRDLVGEHCRLIFSQDEAGQGLLDVVPSVAGKLAALEHLRSQLKIERHRVVFAGDSGNDLEVLVSALPSVLVANASEAVRSQAVKGAAAARHEDRLYLARGGLKGMNGNYSAGILEGLVHFLPEASEWLV